MRLKRAHIKAALQGLKRYLIDLPLLVERQRFLISEVRTLRKQLNEDRASIYPTVQQTKDSFAYQWENIPHGWYLPSDQNWFDKKEEQISEYFNEDPISFLNKSVLDYGCGNGRYALGFCFLGGVWWCGGWWVLFGGGVGWGVFGRFVCVLGRAGRIHTGRPC